MIFNFFKYKKNINAPTFVALDIGSNIVKALVVAIVEKEMVILGAAQKVMDVHALQSGVSFDITSITQNCKEVINIAEKQARVSPEKIIISVPGNLIHGQTSMLSFSRPSSQHKINYDELKNIIQKLQWKAFEQSRKSLANQLAVSEIDIKLIHSDIIDVSIDGYQLKNPIGFHGKKITFQLYNAFSTTNHYGFIQTIAAELNKEIILTTTDIYAVTRAMYMENPKLNAIFIDVGASASNMSVLNNAMLSDIKIFNIGGKTFTKRLANELNISFNEAENVKLAYASDMLERQSYNIVRESLHIDAELWLSGVSLCLSEYEGVLPNNILLSGGGSQLPEIIEVLEDKKWWENMNNHKSQIIRILKPNSLSGISDKENVLNNKYGVNILALSKLALPYFDEKEIITQTLKKITKLMV